MIFTLYAAFVVVVLILVLLDLGVLGRGAHVISTREASTRVAGWVALALAFNAFVYFLYANDLFGWREVTGTTLSGREAAEQYFLAWLLEQSLSVDNMMVIAMIFTYFRVPMENQHRVLFWGIIGALVLRGVMIAAGAALIANFSWIIYVFAVFLILTAVKLLIAREEEIHPERNLAFRIARRLYPVSNELDGSRFFTVLPDGRRAMTRLFLALILVETSDVLFAVDSIPAVFGVTRDPFIVFTSNVFAILGLRSLYFALAGFLDRFRYLKTSLVFILAFVGVKMMLSHHYAIPGVVSLAVILGLLAVGVLASLVGDATRPRPDAPDR